MKKYTMSNNGYDQHCLFCARQERDLTKPRMNGNIGNWSRVKQINVDIMASKNSLEVGCEDIEKTRTQIDRLSKLFTTCL